MQEIHYQKLEMSQASVRWGLESNLVTHLAPPVIVDADL
jgi:hypothetical protein